MYQFRDIVIKSLRQMNYYNNNINNIIINIIIFFHKYINTSRVCIYKYKILIDYKNILLSMLFEYTQSFELQIDFFVRPLNLLSFFSTVKSGRSLPFEEKRTSERTLSLQPIVRVTSDNLGNASNNDQEWARRRRYFNSSFDENSPFRSCLGTY